MELSKTFRIETDYKDHGKSLSWDTYQFSQIIFVDKTHPSNHPLLYQLTDHTLTLEQILNFSKSSAFFFSPNSFLLVGEIVFIDKKKKQILLLNNNIVSYDYLVIACGKKPFLSFQNQELVAALQTLIEALRVTPQMPTSFLPSAKNPSALNPSKKEPTFSSNEECLTSEKQNIGKVVHPYILVKEEKTSFDLDSQNSRFYEVHI